MAEAFTYQKKRKDYGKPCQFSDTEVQQCGYFPVNVHLQEYAARNPNFIQLDNVQELSEHSVNTERLKTGEKGMYHKEGGWPLNVDYSEAQETTKFRKKIEKDPQFAINVKDLTGQVEKCIYQNNQIDLFEEYFNNEISEHIVENLSSKTLMLFKDDNESGHKRSISQMSWHPDGPNKIAVSYAINRFQQMPEKMQTQSYVWDLSNPNQPDITLNSNSPVTSIMYNNKIPNQIGGGCYNGTIAIWDMREEKKSQQPIMTSPVEESHFDPITQFQWMMSRNGTDFVTTSTDGYVKWWDTRKFEAPTESLALIENPGESSDVVGGTCVEYNVDAGPSKLLIGTETGSILTSNKKPKRAVEITTKYGLDQGKHLGPIYSINRSIPNPKYFLSVGDWSCKIWVEDLKTPIIRTKYHGAYLADGCWSPTRQGAFFLARRDGWMDVWDYYYRQNEIAFSHKVSDFPLSSISINKMGGNYPAGKLVALGDTEGTVTLLELCDSLHTPQHKEKENINEMFERELKKEKYLEHIKKQQEKKKPAQEDLKAKEKYEKKKKEAIENVENKFQAMLSKYYENEQDDELDMLSSPQGKKAGKGTNQFESRPVNIIFKHTGMNLDNGLTEEETQTKVFTAGHRHVGENQQFILEATGDGFYFIKCLYKNDYLEIKDGAQHDEAELVERQQNKKLSQQFGIEDAGEGYNFIKNRNSGKYLDIKDVIVFQGVFHKGISQMFKIEYIQPIESQPVFIINKNSLLSLDIEKGSKDAGSKLVQEQANNGQSQMFILEKDSNFEYKIRNANSGLYLDVNDGFNGKEISQQPKEEKEAQLFRIYRGDGDFLIFACTDTFEALEVEGGNLNPCPIVVSDNVIENKTHRSSYLYKLQYV